MPLWAGGVAGASALALALSEPIWRRLARRVGLRTTVARSLTGTSLGILLFGVANSPWQLIVIRAFQGGAGGLGAAIVSLAAAAIPRESLGKLLG